MSKPTQTLSIHAAPTHPRHCPKVASAAREGHHVRESRKILCRLAGPRRDPPPQIVHEPPRGPAIRSRTEGARPPKTEGAGPTIATILRAQAERRNDTCARWAARALIAQAGALSPRRLSAAYVAEIDEHIRQSSYTHATKATYATAVRRTLRNLWELYEAPKLDRHIRTYPGLRPRNVTATDEEKARILAAAPDHLRLWILLCSDLAMRSGTAAKIAPRHYDPTRHILAFTTKYGATLTLPTTDAIDALIMRCDLGDPEPLARQLWRRVSRIRSKNPDTADQDSYERQFKQLRIALGITRRIVPHDLRRTTAVSMLRESGDVRDVQALLGHRSLQSTIWYLDHDIRPVSRAVLETIKRPFLIQQKEKSA